MPITNPVGARDVVFIQRSNDNSDYGQVHISGTMLIFYTDENGVLTADKSGAFYTKFPPSGAIGGADGTNLFTASTYQITSSWSEKSVIAISSSWASESIWSTTSSYASNSAWSITSSFASRSFSANTSSYSSVSFWATSASIASSSLTASFLTLGRYTISDLTASLIQGTSSAAVSSSYAESASWANTASVAISASWAPGSSGGTTLVTASTYVITSSWAEQSITAISSSWASVSFWATSASFASESIFARSSSWASSSITSSYFSGSQITASFISGTLFGSASNAISSSWALNASSSLTSSFASRSLTSTSSSWASQSLWATTSSYASNSVWSITSSFASRSLTSTSSSWASASLTTISSSYALVCLSASYAPGGAQTPWTSNIDGGDYSLENVKQITIDRNDTASSPLKVYGKGDGGFATRGIIDWYHSASNNRVGSLSDDGSGTYGLFNLIGGASGVIIGEFDAIDREYGDSDKRVGIFRCATGGGSYEWTYYVRSDVSTFTLAASLGAGGVTASAFSGDGTYVLNVQTSSYALVAETVATSSYSLFAYNARGKSNVLSPLGSPAINLAEDVTTSDFTNGDTVIYKVYSYVNIGSSKVFTVNPIESALWVITTDAYSMLVDWTQDTTADGYRIFRSVNANGYLEYHDEEGTANISMIDQDNHASSAWFWIAGTEGADSIPTSFTMDTFLNYSYGNETHGVYSNGGGYFNENLFVSRSISASVVSASAFYGTASVALQSISTSFSDASLTATSASWASASLFSTSASFASNSISSSYLSASNSISNRFTASAFLIQTPDLNSGSSLIISQSSPVSHSQFPALDIYTVWSGSVNTNDYNALKCNVIDSGSGATSSLINLSLNNASKFRVNKTGSIITFPTNPSFAAPVLTCGAGSAGFSLTSGFGANAAIGNFYLTRFDNTPILYASDTQVATAGSLGIGSSGLTTTDVLLFRDLRSTLALRNGGTNTVPVSQSFRIYNFYSASGAHFERASNYWSGSVYHIETEYSASGIPRDISFRLSGSNRLFISASGNIGINTLTPTNAMLEVVGNVSASSYTGSLLGTSSAAVSSSYADTASWANTASVAISASYAPGVGGGTTLFTASTYQITSSWAEQSITAISSSWASVSFWATSASFASESLTSSFLTLGRYTISDLTASLIQGTSSWANNSTVAISSSWSNESLFSRSSSYASASSTSSFLTLGRYTISDLTASLIEGTSSAAITSSYAVTSSWANTASVAISASYAPGAGGGTTLFTASTYVITSSWAEQSTVAISSSWASQSIWAISSSFTSESIFARSSSWASSSISSSYVSGTGSMPLNIISAKLPNTSSARIDAGENGWRLLYDAGSPQSASWQFLVPSDYILSASLRVAYAMTGLQSGTNAVIWRVNIYCPSSTNDFSGSSNQGFYFTSSLSNNQVAGLPTYAEIPLSSVNVSMSADSYCWLNLERAATASADTATTDAEVMALTFKYIK